MIFRKVSISKIRNAVIYWPVYAGLGFLGLVWLQYRSSRPDLLAIGFFLIALSCFLYALIPGRADVPEQHDLLLNRYGIYLNPSFGRVLNILFGFFLLLIVYYCLR